MAEAKAQRISHSQLLSLMKETGWGWSGMELWRLVALEHVVNGTSSLLCLPKPKP